MIQNSKFKQVKLYSTRRVLFYFSNKMSRKFLLGYGKNQNVLHYINLLFSLSIKIALCIHFHFNAMHLPKYIGTHFFGNNSHAKTWYLLLCASSLCSFAIFYSLLSILLLIGQRKHLNCNQIAGKNMHIHLVNVDNFKFNYSYDTCMHTMISQISRTTHFDWNDSKEILFFLKDRR